MAVSISSYPIPKCEEIHTLKEALYGIPIGKFAKTAKILFTVPDLKAKL
jgi:hypothetical protein